ncbi:MAG: hypothetical protein ABI597_09220 [Gammaproteobacteria bacterium]
MINEINSEVNLYLQKQLDEKSATTPTTYFPTLDSVIKSIQTRSNEMVRVRSVSKFSQHKLNAYAGLALVQDAENELNHILNLLTHNIDLAAKASSGVYSSTQLGQLDIEFQQLNNEVNRVANATTFNGIHLLNSTGSINIHVGKGNTSFDFLTISLANVTTGSMGLNIESLDVWNQNDAENALINLPNALLMVTNLLSYFKANEIKLNEIINHSAEDSAITASHALLNSENAKASMLNQPYVAVLGQANAELNLVQHLLRDSLPK